MPESGGRNASAATVCAKDSSRAAIQNDFSSTSTCFTGASDVNGRSAVRTNKARGSAKPVPARSSAATLVKKGASTPSGFKVRMYRVGFGDFFLVTVPTRAGDRYIVIDCGVFKGTTGKGDIGSIVEAVDDLFEKTRGQISLVIMTHRHADHIAGFARAERFRDFQVGMVWMPYWEEFNDAKDSPSKLQSDINELAVQLAMQFRGRTDEAAQQAFDMLWNATGIDFEAAAKGAKTG